MPLEKANKNTTIDLDDVDNDGITKLIVNLKFPDVLKKRMSDDPETIINLLQMASVVFNKNLNKNPLIGIRKFVFFLSSGKQEYDFRVHSVRFSPTLDLENTNMIALISSNNNAKIQKLMDDGVLSFFISGKIVQKSNNKLEKIVITHVISHVDQTAYARSYSKPTPVIPVAKPDITVPRSNIDPNDPLEIDNIKSFKDKWKHFASEKNKYEESKSTEQYNKWKQLAKKKVNDAWDKIKD